MTRRARNLASAAIVVVLVLFGGRWLTGFLTVRWWAATISPDAVAAVTSWKLLGLSLDFLAVALASLWFVLQVWMVKSTINAIHVRRQLPGRIEWHPVPERVVVLGAIVLGVLMGVLTGVGARSWINHVALAFGDPRFGIADIATGLDVGWLLSSYPVLAQAQQFILTLGVLGLVLSLMLYLLVDSAAGNPFRPILRPERRAHYAMSMAVIALALFCGALLLPMRIATGVDAPIGDAAGSTRIVAGLAVAGVALATLILTCWWGVSRARHGVLISAWLVLAVAQLVGRVMVPAFTTDSGDHAERARLMRQFDTLMYGIHMVEQTPVQDSLPTVAALWDPDLLADWSGGMLIGAGASGTDTAASWLVAIATPGDSAIQVRRISAGEVGPDGTPLEIGGARWIASPRTIPGADGWKRVESGVRVGGLFRRAVMAWALQAPGILTLDSDTEIDWWLDPRDRARALIPVLSWRAAGIARSNGELVWVLSGMSAVQRAPLSTRVAFGTGTVAGLVPVAVAVIGASGGEVGLYLDPAADSIGTAWGRWFGPAISPADRIPAEVAAVLPYPMEWFRRQLGVLGQPHWNIGVTPADDGPLATSATWSPHPGALQATMQAPDSRGTTAILTAVRTPDRTEIRIASLAMGSVPSSSSLTDAWLDDRVFGHLRDSVSAAGDSLVAGAVRWQRGPAGPVAWQPFAAVGESGVQLVWLGTMTPERIGGGRDPLSAWSPLPPSGENGAGRLSVEITSLRTWIMRADSALARGDLTAFARAWEAIRGIALEAAPE